VQLLVLLGLAALWIAVLLPDILKRRSTRRPIDTITSFKRHLSVLERQHARTHGRPTPMASNVVAMGARQPQRSFSGPVRPLVTAPGARPNAAQAQQRLAQAPAAHEATGGSAAVRSGGQQRRQDVIVALLAGSGLSLLATLTFSGVFLYLHVAIDLVLVTYVGAVLAVTRRNQARSRVSYLRTGQSRQSQANMAVASSQQSNRYIAR
jgi:hypothetical protein